MSDHAVDKERLLSLDARMDDIRAVMDAAGSESAVLLGVEDGFAAAAFFAATYPSRTAGLVAYGSAARNAWAPDYPWGEPPDPYREEVARVERSWGTMELAREWAPDIFPSRADEREELEHFSSWMRNGGGPGDAVLWHEVDRQTDLRDILPAIHVPTLVIHRTEDRAVSIEHGRYIAEHIPGAQLVELPGDDHAWIVNDDVAAVVHNFVAQLQQEQAELDRVLATVMFTDIVGSTEKAVEVGDHGWRELVERHHATVRGFLSRHRGIEMDTAGDGFFATFDGPARAVRCAQAIRDAVRSQGIEIRAGVHTGEVETIDRKAGGLTVVKGSRIGAKAGPSEILASSTVKDLTAGSGLVFEDAGEHELKGVPDRWHLYRVVS